MPFDNEPQNVELTPQGIKYVENTKRKLKYMNALAENPGSPIETALAKAGLPKSLASEATRWDETILLRQRIRQALDKAGATVDFVAEKLYESASKGNIKALELICKLRGYNDPIPESRVPQSNPRARAIEARERIRVLLNLREYPIIDVYPEPAESQAAEAETQFIPDGSPENGIGEKEILLGNGYPHIQTDEPGNPHPTA